MSSNIAKLYPPVKAHFPSLEIARFFHDAGFHLPDPDSSAFDPRIDYEDIKLKLVQREGYDLHDFNFFGDRAALLWRKPYLDGAVRELTSGEGRSTEQLRAVVEQMMLATGDRTPEIHVVSAPAHRASGRVNVDYELDQQQALLRELERNPERYD